MKLLRTHLLFAIVVASCTPSVLAATQNAPQHPAVWSATYVAAYQPQFGTQGVPYAGIMKLKFNHGIISGTYDSQSVRPDPLRGRIVNVTGTIGSDNHVSLRFATSSFTLPSGTIGAHGTIKGTANYNGHLYNFEAKIKSMP
ncbi:MAG TPA: hypothetical protein VFE36_10445 [Candidatus Baltobacteraceae bacterium]|jgi:hypothetical protein|nr:hypothetical protein [Candidatus Baltobacteraceae bacterium]